MSLLKAINSPVDVKALEPHQLCELAEELRERIIETTAIHGGHIGPNLGVVELTIALHRVFDTLKDRITFDVSHQGYAHKLLTGRNNAQFDQLRQSEGYCGFLARAESPHDAFGAGHAGTALSAALGMAAARDLTGSDESIVALCGDAAFTCGITMEALNNVAATTKKFIIILNDNKWSISKNVGAISQYFNELITNPIYNKLNDDFEALLQKVPGGASIRNFGSKWKKETKDFFVSSSLFETYNIRYIGPVDGHDIPKLTRYLEFAKQSEKPVLLHVITTKGKGYSQAIENPERFHGASPFDPATGKGLKKSSTVPKYQDCFGQSITQLARKNSKIVGITAAMPSGTGLDQLKAELPKQFFDVGIAEEHAAIFAAGLATSGFHPVCAIYSTFLQRAYDPIIHDIALQKLPVLFCLDRAGLSPNDGPTHHGLFDIAYLRCIPEVVVMAASDEDQLADMLLTGTEYPGPAFLRYPRGEATGCEVKAVPQAIPIGQSKRVLKIGTIDIWSIGTMLQDAKILAEKLAAVGIDAGVVDARFAKPLDADALLDAARHCKLIVTLEDHVLSGGFGSAVLETLDSVAVHCPVERLAWPDTFIDHGSSVADLRQQHGLAPHQIFERVRARYQKLV